MLTIREAKWAAAKCRGEDPELFFPHEQDRAGHQRAARVCAGCPLQADCRAEAMSRREPEGVWGGTSPTDRGIVKARNLRRHPAPAEGAA